MGLQRFRAAIVDLDGTMVDTLGDFEVALNRTLADLALPPVTRELVERTVGKGSEHLIRSVLAHQMAQPEAKGYGQACPAWTVDSLYERAWALVRPLASSMVQWRAISCAGTRPVLVMVIV